MRRIGIWLGILLCLGCLTGCADSKHSVEITEQNVIRENIVIEGLTGAYDLLFLTDTHMVLTAADNDDLMKAGVAGHAPQFVETEQMRANAEERAPQFVDAEGISSAEQFPAWMEYAEAQQVDAVLLGGDIIDFPSMALMEHLQKQLATMKIPYIYAPGNHDWTYPWEYMTERAKEEYLPLLEPMMQGNTAIQRLDMGEFTVVAVDNSAGQVNAEALETYAEILTEGKPVIVLVHVPFLSQSVLTKAREVWSSPVVIGGGNYGGIYPDEASTAFVEMTTAEDSPVVAVLAGHVHFYDKDYMDGGKAIIQLVGEAGFQRKGMLLHISGK